MMRSMDSVGLMLAMLAFLIVVVGGLLVAFRLYAGRAVEPDHPRQTRAPAPPRELER